MTEDTQRYRRMIKCLGCGHIFEFADIHKGCPECSRIGACEIVTVPVEDENGTTELSSE